MQRIVVSVTNDLVTDQRVHKICSTLVAMNFKVLLIGRRLRSSLPLKRDYATNRMKLLFNKGFLFYAEYNTRLFFKLLFLKKDILLSNDLDTLLPNFLIGKLMRKQLVYDSHELFTEIPELIHRPKTQKIWLAIEKQIFPKLKNVYTVNASIATIYKKKYGVAVHVVRNIAPKLTNDNVDLDLSNRIKGTGRMLILQGAGINVDRGAEEAVEMMQYLKDVVLYIIGNGDAIEGLKKMTKALNLETKVIFIDRLPYEELMEYTKIADLGLSLDKGTNLNYEYALPNKIFDYIQAKTPLLVSNRKLVSELVKKYDVGLVVTKLDPQHLAEHIQAIFLNTMQLKKWSVNLERAAKEFNWETEATKLKMIFNNLK